MCCNVQAPKIPPLCDFVQWIDKEMDEWHSSLIQSWHQHKEEREERQRQRAAMEKAERDSTSHAGAVVCEAAPVWLAPPSAESATPRSS